MRCVISDTGPLLHLIEADALELLKCIGELHIPQSVELEISHFHEKWFIEKPTWITKIFLESHFVDESLAWQQAGLLDVGEVQSIALFRPIEADWFLTDDASARLVAQSLGIEVHGSLGVVLWAAAVGPITLQKAKSTLNALADSSLWISAKVIKEAFSALENIFSQKNS